MNPAVIIVDMLEDNLVAHPKEKREREGER